MIIRNKQYFRKTIPHTYLSSRRTRQHILLQNMIQLHSSGHTHFMLLFITIKNGISQSQERFQDLFLFLIFWFRFSRITHSLMRINLKLTSFAFLFNKLKWLFHHKSVFHCCISIKYLKQLKENRIQCLFVYFLNFHTNNSKMTRTDSNFSLWVCFIFPFLIDVFAQRVSYIYSERVLLFSTHMPLAHNSITPAHQ